MIGACLDKLGVKLGDSRDYLGRHRFHPFRLSNHLRATCPLWYYRHSKYEDTGVSVLGDYRRKRTILFNILSLLGHFSPSAGAD